MGSCFEDPGDGTCDVTGYGEGDDGARIPFYQLPNGEEAYGAVEEVRAWVLAHRAANKRQRRNNYSNVPVPCGNIIYHVAHAIMMARM